MVDLQRFSRLAAALAQAPGRERPGIITQAARGRARAMALGVAYRSGLYRWAPERLTGRGVVFLFHEVHEDAGRELLVGCELKHVLNAVRFCREDGRDIVDLDEACRRLEDPSGRRFAVLTFDDGYRDIRTRVLPALEREGVPFTVFVPTGTITRELYAWWIGLRRLFQENERVEIAAMGRAFPAHTGAEKVVGLRAASAWVASDFARAGLLEDTFRAHGLDLRRVMDEIALSADELREVSSHPLVTIGAHTETHAALALLSDREAEGEMARNKAFLEDHLQRPVDHVAYPYGSAAACGQREARLAERIGFKTGTTTRAGTLGISDARSPWFWPREDVGYPGQSRAKLSAHAYGLHGLLG